MTGVVLGGVDQFFGDESIRRARLVKITPAPPALPIYLTTSANEIEFEGNTYIVANAVDLSAQSEEVSGSSYDVEMQGAIDSDLLTNADLNNGVYRGARVDEYIVDPKYPYAGALRTYTYFIKEVEWDGEVFRTDCGGIQDNVKRKKGETFSRQCVVQLFSSHCGLSRQANQFPSNVPAAVTGVTSRRRMTSIGFPSGNNPNDHFIFGTVQFTSGGNTGRFATIISYDDGEFILAQNMPFAIKEGDTFFAYPGCQKTTEHCANKFNVNNLRNFQGNPYVRGASASVDAPASSDYS